MKGRGLALLGLTALCVGVAWAVARHEAPRQLATLAPVMERGEEALLAADRAGRAFTKLSPAEEAELGARLESRFPPGSEDPGTQAYLEGIHRRLLERAAMPRPTRIRLVQGELPNACALPGGAILVTTAMVAACEDEAELAEVVGHELGHHLLGDPVARLQYLRAARKLGGPLVEDLASLGYTLYATGYSAREEEEADRQGLRMAVQAGYHPQAVRRLMGRLGGRPPAVRSAPEEAARAAYHALADYLATHPPFPERQVSLERAERELADPRGRWFLGRRNHRERVPSTLRRLEEDYVTGPLSP